MEPSPGKPDSPPSFSNRLYKTSLASQRTTYEQQRFSCSPPKQNTQVNFCPTTKKQSAACKTTK